MKMMSTIHVDDGDGGDGDDDAEGQVASPLLFSWPTHPFVSLVDYKGRLPRDKGPDLLNLLK